MVAPPAPSDLCEPWIGYDEVHRLTKFANLTEEQIAPYLMPASEICYMLSGREWRGVCPVEHLRPCRRPAEIYGFTLAEKYDEAFWWGSCSCGGQTYLGICGCGTGIYQLDLKPYAPIVEITEILIDGAAFTGWTIYDWRYLARTDGEPWPSVQRLDRDHTGDDTWSITLTYGQLPPEAAQLACATLAGEFALAGNPGTGTCLLPERIQTVVRQGVTYVLVDPQLYLDVGRTGIYLVDLWLRATNPSGATQRAILSYPGKHGLPGRRRTV
jgi:hypothetical protein